MSQIATPLPRTPAVTVTLIEFVNIQSASEIYCEACAQAIGLLQTKAAAVKPILTTGRPQGYTIEYDYVSGS